MKEKKRQRQQKRKHGYDIVPSGVRIRRDQIIRQLKTIIRRLEKWAPTVEDSEGETEEQEEVYSSYDSDDDD
jgi:hypothetical protein